MSDQEYEIRKKAIFDTMSKRGQERILRIGYENWEPFKEPKDPREIIFSPASQRAAAIVQEFYNSRSDQEESVAINKDLQDLTRGLLLGETRSKVIFDFVKWYLDRSGKPKE